MALLPSELAKRAGVNIETLRFYEKRGLLPAPPRLATGYRAYPEESVRLLRFIKRAQELGFTLVEIRELLALRLQPGTTPADVRTRADAKLADVREKIRDLKAIECALGKLTACCSGEGPLSDCPILHHLETEL